MKIRILLFVFLITCIKLPGQQFLSFNLSKTGASGSETIREYEDNGLKGMRVEWSFPDAHITDKEVNGEKYQNIFIKDFAQLKTVGRPSLPCHTDFIAIPYNSDVKINILEAEYIEYDGYLVHPTLKPAYDTYDAPEPEFEIDTAFYKTDILYPAFPVEKTEIFQLREIKYCALEIRPVQYNPLRKKLRVYSKIIFSVEFSEASQFVLKEQHSKSFLSKLPNNFLNGNSIQKEVESYLKSNELEIINTNSKNYIIITHSNFKDAADSLACWKQQLGYSVEVVSGPSWSCSAVKNEIFTRYQNWQPKPDYFVIIGDHTDVPGELITNGSGDTFATDQYYACMNGSGDYVADMAKGRISVSSAAEAMTVVQKIISYEKNPVSDTSFYNQGLHAAYFQDDDNNTYADRRFAQTSEDVYNYMTQGIGKNVERVYYAKSGTTPIYWNNTTYSAGEPVPSYLQKPTFPWTGNATEIINNINSGTFYVLHRDHGFENGWGDPYFTKAHINNLNNNNKTPVVFSINCLTGKFLETECFCEKFLRKSNGGTVGIFGHAEVSYSGFNDGLSLGLIDAIWAVPGLVPNFTGSGGITNPSLTPHGNILTMGDVANQALMRMGQTWGVNQYTNELFHYFGDPAMKIWTTSPSPITATHLNSIACGNDTTFSISNVNVPDAIATLVVDGELVGKIQLVNGSGVMQFTPVSGTQGILTISKTNYKPYVANISITGACPKAKFLITNGELCLSDSILITDASTGNITSYSWNFGSGANPATANTIGPFWIKYNTSGSKTVALTVTGPNGSHSYSIDFNIDPYCKFFMPGSGSDTIISCSGTLYDNGGLDNYPDNSNVTTTISPPSATKVTLNFTDFEYEQGYDYLYIYDGLSTQCPLIGRFTVSSLPIGGTVNSSGGSITLKHYSDFYDNRLGFVANFNCTQHTAPVAKFSISDSISCTGVVQFNDLSINVPTAWAWDFGDGNTSNQKNPVHKYTANGTYSVKLVSTNAYGTDSIVKPNLITISTPVIPTVVEGTQCISGQVTLKGNSSGIINWYDSIIGGNLLHTGDTFVTPNLVNTTTYYAENKMQSPVQHGGKPDNSGGGGYFTSNVEHYLVFDVLKPIKLISFKVYAGSGSTRIIKLQNSSGVTLKAVSIYIMSGESRVTLNWDIQPGNDYRLVGPNNPNLYRNSSGCSYPYQIPGLVSIKHSSASSNPNGYYYYFYDWEILEPPCVSPRIPVTAYVVKINPTITSSGSYHFCKGDSIILTASQGLSYLWSPTGETSRSIVVKNQNTYHVTVSDSGCTAISPSVAVLVDSAKPMASFTYQKNDPVVIFTNTSTLCREYFWEFGDGDTSYLKDPVHTYRITGNYPVQMNATNYCGKDSSEATIVITSAGISENNIENDFCIYPNPSSTSVTIVIDGEVQNDIKLRMLDITGKEVWAKEIHHITGKTEFNINLNHIASGMYLLELQGPDWKKARKIIIQ